MSKGKHHNKKKNKLKKKREVSQTGPVFMQHPLSKIPRDIMLKGLVDLGKSYQEKFPILLSRVTDIIKSKNPLQIISTLSVYGLFGGMTSTGKVSLLQKTKQISQSDVELVQAIALQIPENMLSETPAMPENIQELFDLLPNLSKAFGLQRLIEIEKEKTEQQKAILMIQEHLRLHTQSVRNWGYFKRVVAIARRLYEPLDPLYQRKIGVATTDLIAIFENLLKRTEKYINERWNKFREIFSGENIEHIISKYYSLNPHLHGSPDRMIEYARHHNLTSDQVKSILLSHSDLSLMGDLTFTSYSLAEELGLSQNLPSTFLDKLSLSFGDLTYCRPEYLFLDNPVWRKPLIKIGKDRYFCAISQVFFSFILQIF
jgi:hypothetical protein